MKALEEKIRREGQALPGNILRVGSFLNQQIDCDFMMEIGREIARLYEGYGVDRILTVEASGIAIALAAGAAMHKPCVFAKKYRTGNVAGETYQTTVHSFTHGNDYQMVVAKEYLPVGERVLLVDDFLANGAALEGLLEIVRQAGAQAVGAAVAIEKGFQDGGARLRGTGIRVESLAIVESMDEGRILFRAQD